MRKQLVNALTTISFLIALTVMTVGSAQGQSLANGIQVNVPFDFIVADKTLPAGEYSIRRIEPFSSENVLVISSVDGPETVTRLTNAVEARDPKEWTAVVFHRYGDQYFLFQVWPAGANTGRVLIKSHAERKIEQKGRNSVGALRENKPMMDTVSIIGRTR